MKRSRDDAASDAATSASQSSTTLGASDARHDASVSPHDHELAALIASVKPSCMIFDLDSTLWNGNCAVFAQSAVRC